MITLLGAFLGFLTSMLPEFFSLYKERSDRKHELEILQLQLKQQRAQRSERLEEVRVEADTSAARVLYKTFYSGVKWVDALNGTVRPVLAYGFFALYVSLKYAAIVHMPDDVVFYTVFWTEEDAAIFAGVISFYYGQRSLSKMRK